MSALELCTLGTASGLPAAHRFGQTIVLTQRPPAAEPIHCLLDVGDGASSLLMRHGYDHRRIGSIIISHMHGDHHGGFIQVVKTCMHLQKSDPLTVLAPAEGISALQAYMEASYLFPEWLGFAIEWVPLPMVIAKEYMLSDGGTVRAFPNAHMSDVRGRMDTHERLRSHTAAPESYSIVYQHTGCRVVYAGNLHGPDGTDELAPFVEPCDILIAELAHVQPAALGRFLAGRAIGITIVTHFNPRWDAVADEVLHTEITAGSGDESIRGRVLLAHDGDSFTCAGT